jgi:hypothetical protein
MRDRHLTRGDWAVDRTWTPPDRDSPDQVNDVGQVVGPVMLDDMRGDM